MLTRSLGTGKLAKERLIVLVITFFSYMCFHASRIPPSITKGVLHPHSESAGSLGSYNPRTNPGWLPFSQDLVPDVVAKSGYVVSNSDICQLDRAGRFSCTKIKHGKADGAKDWCSRYVSEDGKFCLKVDDQPDGKYAKQDCGTANASTCWVIYGIRANLTKEERKRFCTTEKDNNNNDENAFNSLSTKKTAVDGCVLYVQAGGYHLPAEVDSDTVAWHSVQAKYGKPPDIIPAVTDGKVLLGSLMTVYLLFYAFGMFAAGHIADNVSLRWFLSIGLLGSGILIAGIGFAKILDQHNLLYFYVIYGVQGLFQSIGWPTVVAIMGNWFQGDTRGFIMTVWNSHTSVGNMVGKALSSYALSIPGGDTLNQGNNWPATFFACAILISTMSVFVFCFLKESPSDAGITLEEYENDNSNNNTTTSLLTEPLDKGIDNNNNKIKSNEVGYGSVSLVEETNDAVAAAAENKEATGILRALAIPGVIEFALSLFFCKFVAYTFIYWLPYYLGHIGFPAETAGYLSIFFDLGGIPGGIMAGVISDRLGTRGIVIFVYLALTIPALYTYREITEALGPSGMLWHVLLMLLLGALVNGPYALITTAVSADLGQHKSLKGSKALMATVAGIIDGTGSVGAAAQGLVIGWLSSSCQGWNAVFGALGFCSACSAICLARMLWADFEPKKITLYKVVVISVIVLLIGAAIYNGYGIIEDCGVQDAQCLGS